MYIRRWIHNWPQGSCSPIASALSALPFFQFTATICGGPSPEGRTCTMPSGALLLGIIILILYDLSSGDWASSGKLWLSSKAPRKHQAFSHSHGWGWIWTNGMNHYKWLVHSCSIPWWFKRTHLCFRERCIQLHPFFLKMPDWPLSLLMKCLVSGIGSVLWFLEYYDFTWLHVFLPCRWRYLCHWVQLPCCP